MALTQNPASQIKVGFGSFSYTGFCPETIDNETDADVEHIFCNGTFLTTLIQNQVKRYTMELLITSGAIEPPAKGSVVSITDIAGTASVDFMCMGATAKHTVKGTKLNMTLELPTGATYT